MREQIPASVNEVSGQVVEAAFAVHKELGPGLLESVYESCLCHELKSRKIPSELSSHFPLGTKTCESKRASDSICWSRIA
jgi:GxxExxY protein